MSHSPKHFDEITSLFSASCPFGKLSVRENVRSAKRPFGKMSVRQNVFRQSVFRQNVRVPCLSGCLATDTKIERESQAFQQCIMQENWPKTRKVFQV